MSSRITFVTSIYRYDAATDQEDEFDVTVSCDLTEAEKGNRDCPAQDSECDVFSVLQNGEEIVESLSEAEVEALSETAFEEAFDREEAELAAYLDHQIDLRKEERMLENV